MKFLRNIFLISFSSSILSATWFENIPRTIELPDGSLLDCYVTGDQYSRRLHDQDDYTIIMNESDGYFYYAKKGERGELLPSSLLAGGGDPSSLGIDPGYSLSLELYNQKKAIHHEYDIQSDGRDSPSSGVISQINIFIRFADDPDFTSPRSYYDAVFQTDIDEPSLRHYFEDISNNSLTVNTHHYPRTSDESNTSYVDTYNRSYYMPYSEANLNGYQSGAQKAEREHTLLANAVNSILPIIGPGEQWIDVDTNDDGFVDAVSFVIYGSPGDWADLLWPHRWVLYNEIVNINNARVYDYLFMLSESWYFNVGVLCHEFGHVLGAPDYYQYDGGNSPSPIGGWDVMGYNANPPQLPSAFTMWKYFDWFEPIEITQSGTYSLMPVQEQYNSLYKVASPNSDSEYFLLEYRNREGYDANAPGSRSGMLVYRINPDAGSGNGQGPPDEFYVYRPGGDLVYEGNLDQAPYNLQYGHTEINDGTNPPPFLYDNGNGSPGGLNIFDVTNADDSISFTISLGEATVQVDPLEIAFETGLDSYVSQNVTISNLGDPESLLDYHAKVSSSESFLSPQGGPDSGNYFWSTSDYEESISQEWIDIGNSAVQLIFSNNDHFSYQQISLPFYFTFFGETYDYVQVNANGWIGWSSENELVWQNGDIPSTNMPRPAIFGFFDDLNPLNENSNSSSAGNIYYDVNENRVVIWFNDVSRWAGSAGTGTFDFQIVLYSNGKIKCNYSDMVGAVDQATIGWQNSTGIEGTQISTLGESFAYSGLSWESKTYSENGPEWLTLSSSTGDLEGFLPGQQELFINAQASTIGMETGDYDAYIDLLFSNIDSIRVPVTLNINTQLNTKTELMPNSFSLFSPYPNPFNPTTRIRYSISNAIDTKIVIFNVNGQTVKILLSKRQQPGYYDIKWDGRDEKGHDLPTGVYFIKFAAGTYIETQKVVLLK